MQVWSPPQHGWSTEEVAVLSGASYRQIDYWVREGHLKPSLPRDGRWRRWGIRDVLAAYVHATLYADAHFPKGSHLDRIRAEVLEACYIETGWWLIVHPDVVGITNNISTDLTKELLSRPVGPADTSATLILNFFAFADLVTGEARGSDWEATDPSDLFGPPVTPPGVLHVGRT